MRLTDGATIRRLGGAIVLACSTVLMSGMAAPEASVVTSLGTDVQVAALSLQAEPTGLVSNRYGLGVVPLPPPLNAVDRPGPRVGPCPEIKAVILSDSNEDSFVVAGDAVLHRGQATRWAGSRLVVQDLAANQVTFMRGDVAVRCALPKFSMR